MKVDRVIVTVALSLGTAVALPLVGWLRANAWLSVMAVAAFILLWAAFRRAWADVVLAGVAGAALAGAKLLWPQTSELLLILVTTAILSFTYLNATLLIGPWSWFFQRRFLRLLKHRRHVGVASLLLAEVHVNIVLAGYYSYQVPFALLIPANVFGATALSIIALLGLTSWDFAQRKITLRWWNIIHLAGLAWYGGLLATAFSQPGASFALWERLTLLGVVVYWLLLTPAIASRLRHRTVNGWKQLHLLAYAAYVAVVIHIWTGVVSQRQLSIQLIFWTPVVFVVGSHLTGRWMRWRKRLARRQAAAASPTPSPAPAKTDKPAE